MVYLAGTDRGSGVARLEYTVDSGTLASYLDPIAIAVSGTYVVSYRAVDRAGQTGNWQTVTVVVELPRFSGQVRACVLGNTQMVRFILDRRHHVQGRVSPA